MQKSCLNRQLVRSRRKARLYNSIYRWLKFCGFMPFSDLRAARFVIYLIGIPAVFVLLGIFRGRFNESEIAFGIITYMVTCLLFAIIIYECQWDRPILTVAAMPDMEVIGVLLEIHGRPTAHPSTCETVHNALIYGLWRLHSGKGALLTPVQRQRLHRQLLSDDIPMVYAVLHALEQIGNATALSFLAKLIDGQSPAATEPAVREAARRCYDVIRERDAQAQNPQTLLRAGSQPADSPDTLLRGAKDSMESSTTHLLRPSK